MKRLRINWILPRTGMSGGVKANRLSAEAMVRRGHTVSLAYVAKGRPWPRPWQPRCLARRVWRAARMMGRQRHHLESSSANLIPVHRIPIRPHDVPDADVTIATWWATREWIEGWPSSKGVKAYFIRGYEVWVKDPERVRATYRLPGLKLVISYWLQRLMAEEFNDPNTMLVPDAADWGQFDSKPRDKADVPTIGFVYSGHPIKDAGTGMKALRLVRRQLPKLRILAFGAGPILRESNPPPDVEFHLRPPQNSIADLYRRADCWLISSTSEGFGMPGIEAAACRCPVVSTRCGGPEDYVRDGVSGYLVPVGDHEAMAEAIVKVITLGSASWKAMSEASYATARQFDWDRSAEILEAALLKAVDCRDSGSAPPESTPTDQRCTGRFTQH